MIFAEAKLGIFEYNDKQLYYKTRLILIKKKKQQHGCQLSVISC